MMFKEAPADFKNDAKDIVGCYLEHDGRFLLLHRHHHKSNGGKWGLPAGKMDDGESRIEAVKRELYEETDVDISEDQLAYFDSRFVRMEPYDFVWHMFSTKVEEKPEIRLSPTEHQDFIWVTPAEALEMDLIHDLPESIQLFYRL